MNKENNCVEIKVKITLIESGKKSDGILYTQLNYDKIDDNKDTKNGRKTMDTTKNSYEKISAFDAANYIIKLYYQSKTQYRCTRSKVEKLLSIAGFIYMAKKGKPLYEQDIEIKPCGTGFGDFPGFYPSDILNPNVFEDNKEISCSLSDLIDKKKVVPQVYNKIRGYLTKGQEKLLENVFLRFGNYAPDKLGKAIDEFKYKIVNGKIVNGKIVNGCNLDQTKQIVDPYETSKYFSSEIDFSGDSGQIDQFVNQRVIDYETIFSTLTYGEDVKQKLKDMINKQLKDEKQICQKTFLAIVEYVKNYSYEEDSV